MTTKVRFYQDPVQSLCRPLQSSELKLLRLLEEHMQDELSCYQSLRCLHLAEMCKYCQGLATYTLLRFKGLRGRYVRRLEPWYTPTFVEMPWSFKATRFILESLTAEDINSLDPGDRSSSTGQYHEPSRRVTPSSHWATISHTNAPYLTSYRQSVDNYGSFKYRDGDPYHRRESLSVSLSKLVITTIRGGVAREGLR